MAFLVAACGSGRAPSGGTSSRPRDSRNQSPMPAPASSRSCDTTTNVAVPGQANIFGSGVAYLPSPGGGGGGIPPSCVSLPPGTRHVYVAEATGRVSFVGSWFNKGGVPHKCPTGSEVANPASGPDGLSTGTCGWEPDGGTIQGRGRVSGISSSDRVGYLVGVFLSNTSPPRPPHGLDFNDRYDFAELQPRLGQIFFVGDGRTKDGSVQRFLVPKGASRLYLGIADAFAFHGPPGFYDDNSGGFEVTVRFR